MMYKEFSTALKAMPSAESQSIDDAVNRVTAFAQRRVQELGLSDDEAKVLFTYTLEQLLVVLYMHRPDEVDAVIDRVRQRVRQDLDNTSRLAA